MNTDSYPINKTYHRMRLVFMANDVPDDVVAGATLAVVTAYGWHIFGAKRAHSFDGKSMPLPDGLKCMVVDTSVAEAEHDKEITSLLANLIDAKIDIKQFLIGVRLLGAVVRN